MTDPTNSLIQCRKDDKEFLVQCLKNLKAEKGSVDFDGIADYVLNGLMGYMGEA